MAIDARLTENPSTLQGISANPRSPWRSGMTLALAGLLLGGLFFLSQHNFLLFHVVVELCTIGMAIAIFTVAWNTRHLLDNHAFLLLGLGYLGVGGLTLLHTLAYKGMTLLGESGGANMATQLWITARFLEGLAFIGFPLSLKRCYPGWLHLTIWVGVPALLLLLVLLRLFPDCYLETTGLTRFKIVSEYLFCLMGLAALGLFLQRRHLVPRRVFLLLCTAITLSIGGELFFTLYTTVTGLLNVIGHYLHLISVFLIYLALVHSSLTRPLETLFGSLSTQQRLLAARLRLSEMATSLSLEQLLARIIDEALALTDGTIGFFHLVEPDQETLALQAWSGNTSNDFCRAEDRGHQWSLAQAGVWGDCLRQRRAVIDNHYPSLPHCHGLPSGHPPLCRLLLIPIFRGEGVAAIFGVANKASDYEQHDILLLTTLGDFAWEIVLRRQSELAQRQSEERFRLCFEHSPVGTVLLSPDFRFQKSNETFCTMIGYSQEELIGLTFAEITHPEERQRDLQQVKRLLAGEIDRYDVEKRYLHKNGAIVWARVNVTLVRDDQQQPLFFLPIIEDITGRKEAELRLLQRNAYLQAIFRASPVGIGVVRERVLIEGNTRLCEITGYGLEEFLGHNSRLLYPSDEDYRWVGEEKYLQISRHGTGTVETRWRRKDGRIIDVLLSSTPLNPADLGQGVVFSALDISERKEAERRLIAAVAEKDVLLREVHHRVKNNLAAVISLLDMQRRHFTDPRGRELLGELGNRIRSMSLIHEKLYRAPNLAGIDFHDYLRTLVGHLRTSFGATHIDCRTEARDIDLPLDLAVPLGMIVNELVTNVMKHAFPEKQPAAGRNSCQLEVRLTLAGDSCRLLVADNGVGLPAQVALDNAKSLGMVLIDMLGRHQLGGQYTLDAQQGLAVTLTFPLPPGGDKQKRRIPP